MQGVKSNIVRNCLICNKKFNTIPAEIRKGGGKYCSQFCYHKRIISKETRKRLSDSVKLADLEGRRRVDVKYRIKEKHPLWIKDRSLVKRLESRDNPEYRQWRVSIWLRDGYKCRIEDNTCNGRIEAHHILGFTAYPELRYVINNGITLCSAHHPRKKADEISLAPVFTALLKKD